MEAQMPRAHGCARAAYEYVFSGIMGIYPMSQGHPSLPQIPLQFGNYHHHNDFASYIAGKNQDAVELLSKIARNESTHSLYLWGSASTGKTHLLQAACKLASEHEQQVAYIPLKEIQEISPEILHDMGMLDLVCIDDLECISGQQEWQKGLVWLYNELRDGGHSLIMSANTAPTNIQLEIEDLRSRLNWDQVYQLKPANDETKLEILKQKANERSFDLGDDVIEYLMRRVDRDLSSLLNILDKIDHASLAAKRKITIPFVKELIS